MSTMLSTGTFIRATLRRRFRSKRAARADKGLFRRTSAAIARWRQRHTEQEAGRFIAEHGGRLTDDVERQLTDATSTAAAFRPTAVAAVVFARRG